MISMMLVFPADENKREVRLFVEGRNIEELFKDITRAVAKYRWDSPDPYFAVTVRTDKLYGGYLVTIEYGGTSREVGWLKEGLLDETERRTKGTWDMQPAVASFIAFIIACVTIVATFGAIGLKDRRK